MIYPIRMTGLIIGVPQTYAYFEKMQERVISFVTKNSRMSEKDYRKYCFKTGELANDVGSILGGEQEVGLGLIDELGGLKSATDKLYELIKKEKIKSKQK